MNLFPGAPLQFDHAMFKARLKIHDPIGVSEIAGKSRVGAFNNTGAKSQVTGFEGCRFGTRGGVPILFPLVDYEDSGIIIAHHFPVLIEHTVLRKRRRRRQKR